MFLVKKGKGINFQCEVTAETESKAKIKARSELMAERLNPHNYKNPVVSVTRPMQGAA